MFKSLMRQVGFHRRAAVEERVSAVNDLQHVGVFFVGFFFVSLDVKAC